ncbi:MAG TPA: cytochrome P450 [Solirubrobacteraceae bacterium]|nr:cytochrome P450 [Solirubrobacteraceae bacterium]
MKVEELAGPDAHAVFARLRASEPVAWVEALNGWLVTGHDLVLAAMRDAEALTVDDPRFTTGRVIGPSMLSRDGAEHRRHRTPFTAPFRVGAVRERFTARVEEEAVRLVDGLAPRGGGELRTELAGPLAASVVATALGLERVPVAQVLAWYGAIVDAVTQVTAGAPLPEAGRAGFEALRAAILPALDADPLSSLVAAAAHEAHGALDRDEVVSNAAVLLFGGIETTEGMIANAFAHLLDHPDALAAVRADPALLPAAAEESLRMEPAAATVDRYATRDLELGGAWIAAGDLVMLSLAAANRDPARFADPDRFSLTRGDARRHVAFAGGPHVCIGVHLARLEVHTALRVALDRLPNLRRDPARPADPARGLVFRKPDTVHAVWDGAAAR